MAARCTNTRLPLCFRCACPGHVALSCPLQCVIKVKDDSTGKEVGTLGVQEIRKKGANQHHAWSVVIWVISLFSVHYFKG